VVYAREPVTKPTYTVNCGVQMNSLENEVWSTLSWDSAMKLDALPCDMQRRVLEVLANTPRDYRNEQLDRMFDAAARR